MKPARAPLRLDAEQARFRSEVAALGIRSSAELEPKAAVGDRRGEEALDLALHLAGPGYHAFACGLEGPDRLERVASLVRARLRREEPLPDWVYVHNFTEPNRPRAIRLPAGEGRRFESELAALLRGLREDLPKAFREEAFETEKAAIVKDFEERYRAKQKEIQEIGRGEGFVVAFTPQGNVAIVPLVEGKPIASEEELRALGPERIAELEEAREGLTVRLRDHFEQHRLEHHRLEEEIGRIEREFAGRIVRQRMGLLKERFENDRLARHLDELVDHMLDHLEDFRGEAAEPSLPVALLGEEKEPLAIYAVNVVVDNGRSEGPAVLVVDGPTYKNFFGTIDRTVDRFGRISTDFRRIHAGALLEADGGVVVVAATDALIEPFVWRILRRSLRSGRVEIEAYDPFVGITAASLRPEPIQVSTKVVLVGPRWLFEMLLQWDEEFRELFKILADFSPVVERDEEATRALCGRIAGVQQAEALPPLDAGALDALVEFAVREAGDRRKLDLGSERVLDMAREAGARARADGLSATGRGEVEAALRARLHRLDRIEEALREAIARGQLLVEVEGKRVGQLNALSVSELGGHAFGRPSRVTATVGLGAEGVVSIDRETELSGATHDKGVLILESFLRDRFARTRPLSLQASVVFEQSYGWIEGDSASLAELLAILSRIGDFELRQDVAVTGSVNQRGEVQAIGGIDAKVEGFFDCCRAIGLSGGQAVVFPRANVENLVLRSDVADAVAEGRFHLHPVESVDEALEVMTGLAAGSPLEPDTLNGAVDGALEDLAQRLKGFTRG